MELPECPSHREKRGCERSQLRLLRETDRFWHLLCANCATDWILSKPRAKAEGQWRAWETRLEKASSAERDRMARPSHIIAPRGGWHS